MAFPYVGAVLGLKTVVHIVEIYLNIRQYAALELHNLPKPLEGVVTEQRFKMSQYYALDKSEMCIIQKTIKILAEMAMLYFGLLPFFWEKSGDFLAYYNFNMENEIVNETIQTLVFVAVLGILVEMIDLPFSLYWTFVIDTRHRLYKQTAQQFFSSWYKNIGYHFLLTPLSIFAIIVIIQNGGPHLAFYLWFFTFVVSILALMLYPIVVAPLVSNFSPLPDGALRVKIESLASSLKFPLKQIFVTDGSIRPGDCDYRAYTYGIFNNMQIAVSDTLIEKFQNDDEVAAVIAHGMGHWKLNHTIYSIIAFQAFVFLQFGGYMLVRNSRDMLRSFGFETRPVMVEVIIFERIAAPLVKLGDFALNALSRLFEYQADAFAMKLGYTTALRSYIIKLQENTPTMNIDPWYSAWCFSKPKFVERLAAIDDYAAKKTD